MRGYLIGIGMLAALATPAMAAEVVAGDYDCVAQKHGVEIPVGLLTIRDEVFIGPRSIDNLNAPEHAFELLDNNTIIWPQAFLDNTIPGAEIIQAWSDPQDYVIYTELADPDGDAVTIYCLYAP